MRIEAVEPRTMPPTDATSRVRILLAWPPDPQRSAIVKLLGEAGHQVTLWEAAVEGPYPLRAPGAENVADLLIVRASHEPHIAFAVLALRRRNHPSLPVIAVVDERRSWVGGEVARLGADRIIEARWASGELPAAVGSTASPERPDPRGTGSIPGGRGVGSRPRIALAEDDLEMRRFIAQSLRRDGYEVLEFCTGLELLEALTEPPDRPLTVPRVELIISDLRMPGLTGLEVRWRLRGPDRRTPFILMTAFGGVEVRNEAVAIGAAAVIDKPFDMTELRATVAEVMASARC